MAVLILGAGGASPVTLAVTQRVGEGTPSEVGSLTESFQGSLRNSIRGIRRNFGAISTHVDTATKDAIKASFSPARSIACSGDLLGNLQTLCAVKYSGAVMIPNGLWEVTLALAEAQSNATLLRYSPGDAITGDTFTRSTVGNYFDVNGVLVTAAINARRDSHYIGGVRSLLLEDSRINILIWNQDLTNAAWVKTNITAVKDQTGISGGANTASRITASAANGTCLQSVTTGSANRIGFAYVKRLVGSGVIQVTMDNGANWNTVTPGVGVYAKVVFPNQTLANPIIGFRIVTSGDSIAVDYTQNEIGTFDSSPIATTTVAVTRGADFYSLPFAYPPQEMTIYCKLAELGAFAISGARLFEIANSVDNSPRLILQGLGTLYQVYHGASVTFVTSSLASGPALNDSVELCIRLFADGSVDATQSLNSGATTASTQSAANLLATAWAGQLCWLGSQGNGSNGFTAIRSFKIVAGARTMAEMRAL